MMDREEQLKQLWIYKAKMQERKSIQEQLRRSKTEKEKLENTIDNEVKKKIDKISFVDSATATYLFKIKAEQKQKKINDTYFVIKSIKTLCILFILILLVATVLVSIFTFGSFDFLKLGVVVGVVFFFLVAFLPPETKDADKAGKGYTGVSSYVYFAINIGLALINTFLFPILNKKTCFALIGVSILACILWLFIIPLGRKWRQIAEDESYEIMTNDEKTTLENLEEQDAINRKKNDEQKEIIKKEVYADYEQKIRLNQESQLALVLQAKIVEQELSEMKIISKEDENIIDEVINVMTKNTTYSVKDAISYIDNKHANECKKRELRKKRLSSGSYGGKHWMLSDLALTEANIEELELDAEDLFHSFQYVSPSEFKTKIYDSWFGEAVTVAMLLEKPNFSAGADFRKEIVAKLKNSGSWKLKILGMTFELTVSNVIYSSELSPDLTLHSTYSDEEIGRSNEEKEYFSTLNLGSMIACGAFKKMASEQLGMGSSYSSNYGSSSYSSSYSTPSHQSVGSSSSQSYDPNGPEYNYAASGSGSYNISHADKKVCIVNSAWDADQKVFFTNSWEADVKYYIVNSSWDADLKVFPVTSAWDADVKAYRIN